MDDGAIQQNGGGMSIGQALVFAILMSALASGYAGPAMAQACTRQGIDVACDDGRRGILSGDAIIWPDGSRSGLTSPQASSSAINRLSSSGRGCLSAKATAWCRWIIRARRTKRAAPFSTAFHIATRSVC
jgi:hypothetical protein